MPKAAITIPAPESRVDLDLYLRVRKQVLEHDQDGAQLIAWSNDGREPPQCAEDLAAEIIWIVLCAGRSAQAARTIETKVWAALDAGRSAYTAFGYRAKAQAIDRAWSEREQDFAAFQEVLGSGDESKIIQWCGTIPYVGAITRYQLAKNVGRDVPKPDIWLCRLAGLPDRGGGNAEFRFEACMELCRPLAQGSGDSVATVDSILWIACNKGVLRVDAQAGPIAYAPQGANRKSIFAAAQLQPMAAPIALAAEPPDQMTLAFDAASEPSGVRTYSNDAVQN